MDNSTHYEIIEKSTGNIYEVTGMSFGEEIVTATTMLGDIVFTNKDKIGDLQNELYAIREVGTNLQPDGIGTINNLGQPTE